MSLQNMVVINIFHKVMCKFLDTFIHSRGVIVVSIIDDVKSVARVVQHMDNQELSQKMLALQTEIIELAKKNDLLKEQIINDDGSYWINKPGGLEGPFCTKCYDTEKLLIRTRAAEFGNWCVNCKAYV